MLTGIANATKDKKTTYTYTLTGEAASQATTAGGSVSHTYNAFGDELTRTTVVNASQGVDLAQNFIYDLDGNLVSEQSDPNGADQVLTSAYDAFDRQVSVTDQYGNKNSTVYDPYGRVIATIDAVTNAANGTTGTAKTTQTTYDPLSRVLTTKDGLGNTTTYSYNDAGLGVTESSALGFVVTTTHNHNDQTVTVSTETDVTNYSYDLDGNLTGISDNLGTIESSTYDSADRKVTDTNADGVVTQFTYDAANRVFTKTVDPTGLALTTSYQYDGQGNTIATTAPNGVVTATTYDNDGRVIQVAVDPSGLNLVTTYTYDNEGDVVTVTQGAASSNPRVTQYTYDALGRRTKQVVDPGSGNNPATGQPYLNLTTQYRYDANGNLVHKIDANGNSTWYVYDADNRLHYTVDALGGITETDYDADGRVSATRRYATPMTPPASTVDRLTAAQVAPVANAADRLERDYYDSDGREEYTIDAAGTVTQRTYNAAGNVIQLRVISVAALTGTYATTAAVTSALGAAATTLSAADRVQWTAYDARGRAIFTVDGTGAVTQNQYDAAGNVSSTTQYATLVTPPSAFVTKFLASGQTITVNGTTTITVGTSPSDRTTRYWYDNAGRQVYTLSAAGYLTQTQYNDSARTQTVTVYEAPQTIPAGTTTSQLQTGAVAITKSPGTTLSTGQVVGADQTTTTYYDTDGRVSQVTDAVAIPSSTATTRWGTRPAIRTRTGRSGLTSTMPTGG